MRAPPAMLLAVVPLGLWGAWALWFAFETAHWANAILGCVAFIAVAGLLLLKPWAKYLAYAFAAWLSFSWAYAVVHVLGRGWPSAGELGTAISLLPGICLVAVCAGGVYVVHKQFRHRAPGA